MKIKFLDKFVLKKKHLVIEEKDFIYVVYVMLHSVPALCFWTAHISYEQGIWFLDLVIQNYGWTKIVHNLESKKYVLNRPYSYRDYAFFIEKAES